MAARVRIPESYRSLAALARKQGWTIGHTTGKSGHLAWKSPQGLTVFTPGSPRGSGSRILPIVRKLRNAGLVIPRR